MYTYISIHMYMYIRIVVVPLVAAAVVGPPLRDLCVLVSYEEFTGLAEARLARNSLHYI